MILIESYLISGGLYLHKIIQRLFLCPTPQGWCQPVPAHPCRYVQIVIYKLSQYGNCQINVTPQRPRPKFACSGDDAKRCNCRNPHNRKGGCRAIKNWPSEVKLIFMAIWGCFYPRSHWEWGTVPASSIVIRKMAVKCFLTYLFRDFSSLIQPFIPIFGPSTSISSRHNF